MKATHPTEKKPFAATHFLLGLTMALSVSLCALEWGKRHYHLKTFTGKLETEDDWTSELPPVTLRNVKLPQPPRPKPAPQPAPPAVITQIVVASNDEHRTTDPGDLPDFDDLDFSGLIGADTVTDAIEIPVDLGELTEWPSFPGGDEAFERFMRKNLSYPRVPRDLGIEGPVYLRFVIGKDGRIVEESIRVTRSPHDHLSDEAIRVLKLMPAWNPGKQGVYPKPVIFNFPISFRLR